VKVDGKRIAIARCGDGVAAFSDHCTHRGGPLSDGAIVGCTVQCPWHGSQYDIHTGRVVSGPSDRQIETYETEIRNGEVYLLPTDYQRRQKTAAEVRTKEEGQEKRPAA
jgi:nitrite reductase/ring-hydroxylating ferredoxin subunit